MKIRLILFVLLPLFFTFTSCEWFNSVGNPAQTYTAAGGSINGGSINTFFIDVTEAGEVISIEDITLTGFHHGTAQEISIGLESPGGLNATIVSGEGSLYDYRGTYTFVDDTNENALPYFIMDNDGFIIPASYQSEGDLDDFNGKDIRGIWRLRVISTGTTTGSLSSWSLQIRYREY